MSTTKDSANPRATTTGNRGRYARGLALAERKVSEYGYAGRVERIGEFRYRVPSWSRDGERYKVDLSAGACECVDRSRGNTCMHILAAEIRESRRRARLSKFTECPGCAAKIQLRDTVEVQEWHAEDHLGLEEGELLCLGCARRAEIA